MTPAAVAEAPMGATLPVSSPTRPAPSARAARLWRWLVVFLVVGLAVRLVRYLLQFPIWGDEAFVCLNLTDSGFGELVGRLRFDQVAPVLFLWTELIFYHRFGGSELGVRLLPMLAGVVALVLFVSLARRVLSMRAAVLAVGLLAVSYYPVRHACEVKPYSGDLLFSVALLLPAAAWLRDPRSPAPLDWLCLVGPLALGASYPAAFTAGAVSLALAPAVLRRRQRAEIVPFLLYNLLTAGSFAAVFLLTGRTQHEAMLDGSGGYWDSTFPPGDPLSLLLWQVTAHTGNMLAYPVGGKDGGSTLTFLLCAVGVWRMARSGRRSLLILLLAPFALTFVAAVLHRYPYGGSARIAQHLAPSICLLMAEGVIGVLVLLLPGAAGRRAWTVVAAGLIAFGAAGLVRDLVRPYKTEADLKARAFARAVLDRSGTDRVAVLRAPPRLYPSIEWYLRLWGPRVIWVDDLEEARPGARRDGFWCLRFSTNEDDNPDDGEVVEIDGRVYRRREAEEIPLRMGREPDATRSCVVERWEKQR